MKVFFIDINHRKKMAQQENSYQIFVQWSGHTTNKKKQSMDEHMYTASISMVRILHNILVVDDVSPAT
jgi:hypothetical protein